MQFNMELESTLLEERIASQHLHKIRNTTYNKKVKALLEKVS